MQAKYKRILLKISGEALSGEKGHGYDTNELSAVAKQIADVAKLGVQVGLVVGGGNFWRGRQGDEMDRTTADYMGMLATVINALAVSDALERHGVEARVLTSMLITGIGEPFNYKVADRYLNEGKIVFSVAVRATLTLPLIRARHSAPLKLRRMRYFSLKISTEFTIAILIKLRALRNLINLLTTNT